MDLPATTDLPPFHPSRKDTRSLDDILADLVHAELAHAAHALRQAEPTAVALRLGSDDGDVLVTGPDMMLLPSSDEPGQFVERPAPDGLAVMPESLPLAALSQDAAIYTSETVHRVAEYGSWQEASARGVWLDLAAASPTPSADRLDALRAAYERGRQEHAVARAVELLDAAARLVEDHDGTHAVVGLAIRAHSEGENYIDLLGPDERDLKGLTLADAVSIADTLLDDFVHADSAEDALDLAALERAGGANLLGPEYILDRTVLDRLTGGADDPTQPSLLPGSDLRSYGWKHAA